jgi:UDP-N-acetylglucosamine 1-carboxyvinyltransferase
LSVLKNVPNSQDLIAMINLMEFFGAKCNYSEIEKTLTIDTKNLKNEIAPIELFQEYRASVLFAGPLLAKFKEVFIGFPGGDQIGKRPLDIHLNAFKALGAEVEYKNDYIHVKAKKFNGGEVFLDYASVGATQNIILLASSIEEKTIIYNVAQEPEIYDLVEALKSMGAKIECKFQSIIEIFGTTNLRPYNHEIIADRLEAATLILAAAVTKGSIKIPNAPAYAMKSFVQKLKQMNHAVIIGTNDTGITFISSENPKAVSIKTMPYPGFSTDLQPQMMALLALTPGESSIHETVFESRMSHAFEMNKMGANIKVEYDYAKIIGTEKLIGTIVKANDIRAFASLVLTGLSAEGETKIYGVKHLLRGYVGLDKKIKSLGGNIELIHEDNFKKLEPKEIQKTI